ncbi:hypothetical protein GTY20_37030 [Streptomyces sp. SID4946]|uniref:hypothetical protein n=1 Tax=Streptomyces TaxID=1883 RepID=UPI00081D460F|nr:MULTISPECIES: hypothetical protein [unclassified Streptomyces]MBJ6999631.1 hypothetical protein [Streptomyces sp. CRPSP2-6A1]MYQ96449.1 hypothetical protein [Streptomyces sp. SID4946]SCG00645.1 hypothetical protein GA0115256_143333 [Streptomyces sp. DconLS]SCG03543.1 hypothetical protein GA0115258_126840 [Streptomyces sp. LamerLS-31b]
MTSTHPRTAVVALLAATALGALTPAAAHAASGPAGFPAPFTASATAQAREAASSPATLHTLSRFFARAGALKADAARPHLVGPSVTVYSLAPGFVAGRPGAPVAAPQFVASKAVSADGQVASLWTVRTAQGWKVVNIATGGDETDYVGKAHGRGTVFQEPQIDAWYVVRDGRVLPLDPDARRAVGKAGVSLADYQRLVHEKYGDKLPGSAYDRAGKGGGYDGASAAPAASSVPTSSAGAATATAATSRTSTAFTAAATGMAAAAVLAVCLRLRRTRRSRRVAV